MRKMANQAPEPSVDLKSLIKEYKANDTELKSYEKVCKEQNAQIKKTMAEMGIEEFDADTLIATVTTSVREDFNMDKLLAYAKEHGLNKCIKTIEVIDMDVLEAMIYNSEVPETTLAGMSACKVSKEVVTLRVKEKKEKSNAKGKD